MYIIVSSINNKIKRINLISKRMRKFLYLEYTIIFLIHDKIRDTNH